MKGTIFYAKDERTTKVKELNEKYPFTIIR